jgi:cytoskeletal protein RodZ
MKEEDVLGLATIRKNRGISLAQIAESTKISIRSLEAIERGDFRKLPGGIYDTSYIRQYAKAIDYDESLILEYYNRTMGIGIVKQEPARGGRGFCSGYRPSALIGS